MGQRSFLGVALSVNLFARFVVGLHSLSPVAKSELTPFSHDLSFAQAVPPGRFGVEQVLPFDGAVALPPAPRTCRQDGAGFASLTPAAHRLLWGSLRYFANGTTSEPHLAMRPTRTWAEMSRICGQYNRNQLRPPKILGLIFHRIFRPTPRASDLAAICFDHKLS
jgi:hypothetical protein